MHQSPIQDVVTKSTSIGTLAWAAPELLINTRISSAVDIYSLGVILWEIATGLVPMRGRMRSLRCVVSNPCCIRIVWCWCVGLVCGVDGHLVSTCWLLATHILSLTDIAPNEHVTPFHV